MPVTAPAAAQRIAVTLLFFAEDRVIGIGFLVGRAEGSAEDVDVHRGRVGAAQEVEEVGRGVEGLSGVQLHAVGRGRIGVYGGGSTY